MPRVRSTVPAAAAGGPGATVLSPACRRVFHAAVRNWALDYRRGDQQRCFCNARVAQSEGGVSPLRDPGSPDYALRYPLARFVAEVLRSTIVGSVRFGVIPLDQQDDPGCKAFSTVGSAQARQFEQLEPDGPASGCGELRVPEGMRRKAQSSALAVEANHRRSWLARIVAAESLPLA